MTVRTKSMTPHRPGAYWVVYCQIRSTEYTSLHAPSSAEVKGRSLKFQQHLKQVNSYAFLMFYRFFEQNKTMVWPIISQTISNSLYNFTYLFRFWVIVGYQSPFNKSDDESLNSVNTEPDLDWNRILLFLIWQKLAQRSNCSEYDFVIKALLIWQTVS